MIDIHSHILNGIDDGSKSLEESINILRQAINSGYTDIILTPHYMSGSKYIYNNEDKKKKLEKLKNECIKRHVNIRLYLGNEIYYDDNLLNFIDSDDASTLNDSNYLLFELPLDSNINSLRELVFKLKLKGYIPILAHPERYSFVKDDINMLYELSEQGVLFQCNIGSFFGQYGKQAEINVKLLYKHNLISFLATDVHHKNTKVYDYVYKLDKVIDKKDVIKLTVTNPNKILFNDVVTVDGKYPFKKGILSKWD